jgi:hypothetical protein
MMYGYKTEYSGEQKVVYGRISSLRPDEFVASDDAQTAQKVYVYNKKNKRWSRLTVVNPEVA